MPDQGSRTADRGGLLQRRVGDRGVCPVAEPPPLPAHGHTRETYARLAAAAWLDTRIRNGTRFRHCLWPDRDDSRPAADAPVHMFWLAEVLRGDPLEPRLRETARASLRELSPENWLHARVAHVPMASPVLFGDALRLACLAGDQDLIRAALDRVRALRATYRGGVPRGAQTWEVPLHTPDILAAAHMVSVCVRGYELTREPDWLDGARYWAWTGAPFVCLVPLWRGPSASMRSSRSSALPIGEAPSGSACPCRGAAWSTPTPCTRWPRTTRTARGRRWPMA